MSVGDLLIEATTSISRRPMRSFMTALGTFVGTAAFAATLGVTATAEAQISDRFDLLRATQVRVTDGRGAADYPFPEHAEPVIERINGVVSGGAMWSLPGRVVVSPRIAGTDDPYTEVRVIAAEPGAVRAALPEIHGRSWDAGHLQRRSRVALVGTTAADRMGLPPVSMQPTILINDIPFTVIGTVDDVGREPRLLSSVVIPSTTARDLYSGGIDEPSVLVSVEPGAAQSVGSQLPLALHPQATSRLIVDVPPEPALLRRAVESDTTRLFLAVAALSLLVGMIGIANATLVAVIERRQEIGLRRAIGARSHHIAVQLLTETGLIGATAGAAGLVIGVLATLFVSRLNAWTPTLAWEVVPLTPIIGTMTGLIAGLYPAMRAARSQPVDALRS